MRSKTPHRTQSKTNGSQIIGEETNGNITLYIYDESGSPIGMQYHGANYSSSTWDVYWFEKNIFGDVVGVYNHQGTKLVSYAYEAYGYTYETFHNDGGNTTAKNNPFRYRSYYFDLDLKFYYLGTRYYDQETYRFISADTTAVLTATPGALTDKNLYAYCDNNPVMRVDYSGEYWDYALDAIFLIWGIIDVVNDPSDWKNWTALVIDFVLAVIPFVTSGSGQIIKAGNKLDNALDIANAINKVDNVHDMSKVTIIGRKMNRVTSTAKLINQEDNLYKLWKGYDNAATGIKRFLHNGISMAHNGGWLLGKLRKGYTVIDIGLPTMLTERGLWYGTERIILELWKTRNIWKLPINYYL